MKKMMFLLLLFFLLVGCAKKENEVSYETSQINVETQDSIIENNDKIEVEKGENIVEHNEEYEQEDDVVDETEPKPKYYLHNNIVIKPLNEQINEKVVLLTIDDAPEHYSLEMAKILEEQGINAIFFVNGHFLKTDDGRAKLKAIYDLGFEIGNHTMTHPNLRDLDIIDQEKQIIELNDLVEKLVGKRPRFFRAPYGVNTDTSKRVVEEEGMQWMNWSYGYDFQQGYMEKEALADIMVNTNLLSPGANLLMHDRKFTYEALPSIIDGLRDKGYSFVDPREIK